MYGTWSANWCFFDKGAKAFNRSKIDFSTKGAEATEQSLSKSEP